MNKILNELSETQITDKLNSGGIGVLATDKLYGLACRAADTGTVKRLYGLKKRQQKPGTIIAVTIDQLVELGFKARYLKAVESYWPGAVSVVIPCVDLVYLHLGVGSIAVRLSADEKLNKLINVTGPLLTTSANAPGQPPANTIVEAQDYFADKVDFYADGGDLTGRQPSTVIRIVDDAVEILRHGAVDVSA